MATLELSTRKVVARLEVEGWIKKAGGKHDLFVHPEKFGKLIPVPRHKVLTSFTARSIAKAAGWK
jgi:predicted RNA binding protein YcfA (HicA-like mRNA interferase family)